MTDGLTRHSCECETIRVRLGSDADRRDGETESEYRERSWFPISQPTQAALISLGGTVAAAARRNNEGGRATATEGKEGEEARLSVRL